MGRLIVDSSAPIEPVPADRVMAAADAQLFWMSAKVPNDQFLLFGFDGSPDDMVPRSPNCAGAPDPATSCGCG